MPDIGYAWNLAAMLSLPLQPNAHAQCIAKRMNDDRLMSDVGGGNGFFFVFLLHLYIKQAQR